MIGVDCHIVDGLDLIMITVMFFIVYMMGYVDGRKD